MKVLFVNSNEGYGGAARAAVRIMHGVKQHGVDVQLFVKYKWSNSDETVSIAQFSPRNLLYKILNWFWGKLKNQWQHYKWKPYPNKNASTYLSDLRSVYIHGAFQKLDYDILHLHWINNRFLDIKELGKVHKPIVWTLHDSWAFCGLCHYTLNCDKYQTHCGACPLLQSDIERDLSYEVFEKKVKAYKGLNLHIVTPSRWLGECVKNSALLRQFPVHVIPNCLDTENVFHPLSKEEIVSIAEREENAVVRRVFSEATQEKRLAKPLILYGAMQAATDRRKGFASLLSALQILDKQSFVSNLIVFGAEAQELPMHFEHIDVTFVGYIGDNKSLSALYSIADVMVVPSYSEVFGQTASEAMSCGTPVVAFRCTGIQDVVEEGCGYLAEPYSSEDIARGIRYCIENNIDNILGKNARESAVKRFAIEVVAQQYIDLYKQL